MKRRLFTILSALSLLLFVAVVGLWVRSYWVGDAVSGGTLTTWTHWYSWSGRCSITHGQFRPGTRGSSRWKWVRVAPSEIEGDHTFKRRFARLNLRFAGLEWLKDSQEETYVRLVVPYWMPAVAALGTSAFLLHKQRRKQPGLCPRCGYDLRATPGRCPECGLVPAAARAAAGE